ncbi:probable inactive receptor kinase At1g48480 [Coffea arabica]|uniref:Probable inactive receptor kinase At1g48480 n=1 Tax=Coffea arabica TaxID=13443 RepID=A0ABM4V8Y7_COFAR|nr:probable inactive receptor kinase RLK902 [Coffea arabica]XP_027078926.1 probable inactive receptor kinase RLK902 [Coffea arabica]
MAAKFTCIRVITAAILLILLPATTFSDLSSDRAALLALRSALGGRSALWNVSEPNICLWAGVTCSSNHSTVIELHLPAVGLSGSVPPNTVSNLTNLQTLSMRFNSLSGPLPSDLSRLSDLRNLYLQHNFFSGPIPDSLSSLANLVRLNLADNNFSGPIPTSFENLTRLATLYLEKNNLSGPIPDLNLPGLVQFNVSNNQLTGPIPKGIAEKNPKSAFEGNPLCGQPLNDLCDNGVGHSTKKKGKGLSGGAIAGIVIGCVVGLLLIVLILLFLCRKRREKGGVRSKVEGGTKQSDVEMAREKPGEGVEKDGVGGGFAAMSAKMKEKEKGEAGGKSLVFFGKVGRGFDLEDLLKASAEVLGKGTFGTAYKAGLETGITVAVKRLRDVSVSEKEFREKIEVIGKMNHVNLVPLLAYYYSRDEKLLVYDYLPMGSLSALLHGNKGAGRTPLNWETRAAIALGAARGITYLHSQGPSISHGNIKSSNILLTTTYEARVSDFGLAQLVSPNPTPNRVAGYRAPEVTDPRKISQKADVYSFGVLLLELLTGKAPTHSLMNEEGVDLPRWVQSVVREEWTAEVFDLELLRYQSVEEDMVQLLQLAVDCTAQYPDKRPSMVEVSSRIEEIHRSSLQDPAADIIDETEEKQA